MGGARRRQRVYWRKSMLSGGVRLNAASLRSNPTSRLLHSCLNSESVLSSIYKQAEGRLYLPTVVTGG